MTYDIQQGGLTHDCVAFFGMAESINGLRDTKKGFNTKEP